MNIMILRWQGVPFVLFEFLLLVNCVFISEYNIWYLRLLEPLTVFVGIEIIFLR